MIVKLNIAIYRGFPYDRATVFVCANLRTSCTHLVRRRSLWGEVRELLQLLRHNLAKVSLQISTDRLNA